MAADSLLAEAADDVEREPGCWLLAARDKTSGAWLHASPISFPHFLSMPENEQ